MTKEEIKESLTMMMDIVENAPEDKDYALIFSIHENTLESDYVARFMNPMSYMTMCNMLTDIIIRQYEPPVNHEMTFDQYLECMLKFIGQRVKDAKEQGLVRRYVGMEDFLSTLFDHGIVDEGL